MPDDADWLQKLFSEPREPPVIRGLNLALKLADPSKLPLMLWDIVAAQPKIDLAIRELSFLHFARFVPSWDGSALMVITEFDGPLDDYVLDFVIVVGDVFDKLLSYVQSPPPLPVREHPSEFLLFVRQWNRVPYGPRRRDGRPSLLPRRFDFPIYEAYPDKAVLDIRPRHDHTQWLPPVADRPAAVVNLEDVQGNILKGYHASRAWHWFLHVQDAAAARAWLAKEFGCAWRQDQLKGLTNAAPWPLKDAGRGKLRPIKPPLAVNIGFTWMGLQMLLPWRQRDLDKFPTAFREGATRRAADNGDTGASAPKCWLFGKDNLFDDVDDVADPAQRIDPEKRIHVVLSLFDLGQAKSPAEYEKVKARLHGDCMIHGLSVVREFESESLPQDREHFGYRDSIAQPRISGLASANARADLQPAASPGEFLLGKDYASIYGGSSLRGLPEDLAQNGSFGVMRLIEQDVQAFERVVASAAAHTQISKSKIKACLMGRWPDGHPLSLDEEEVENEKAHPRAGKVPRNDFDYAPSWEYPKFEDDHDGARCPLGAHARRVNPRSSDVPGLRHSRRLIRRGMPAEWREPAQDGPAIKRVGLLGLFFCANLERQFEFIQRHWIQGSAANSLRGSQDPIAGLRSQPTLFRLSPDCGDIEVEPLVKTRGCLYLFYPGLRMLRGLNSKPRPKTPATPKRPGWLAGIDPLARVQATLRRAPHQLLQAALHQAVNVLVDETRLARWRVLLEQRVPQLFPTRFADGPKGVNGPMSLAPMAARPKQPQQPLDATSSTFIADPYTDFRNMRGAGRNIIWVREHRAYWVLSAGLVKDMLASPDDFRQAPSGAALRGILRQDGARHRVVSEVVKQALGIAIEPLDTYLDDAIAGVLPRLRQLDQFDFVREFAAPVPKRVFWRFFGLPADEAEVCDALAQTMMRYYSLPDPAWDASRKTYADATVRLAAHLGRVLVRAWIEDLGPGNRSPFARTLIGEIASRTQIDLSELPVDSLVPPTLYRLGLHSQRQRPLAVMEALTVLMQLVLAGYMSTQFLLGSAMLNFLRPDPRRARGRATPWQQLAKLDELDKLDEARRRDRLAMALQEAIRFDPPVAILQRYVPHDPIGLLQQGSPALQRVLAALRRLNIAPQSLRDCPIFAIVASANRDGAGLDEFHWDRKPQANFSLGHGMHECAGRELQKRISLRAFEVLLKEFPKLGLCQPDATPAWLGNIYYRGLTTLSVRRLA